MTHAEIKLRILIVANAAASLAPFRHAATEPRISWIGLSIALGLAAQNRVARHVERLTGLLGCPVVLVGGVYEAYNDGTQFYIFEVPTNSVLGAVCSLVALGILWFSWRWLSDPDVAALFVSDYDRRTGLSAA